MQHLVPKCILNISKTTILSLQTAELGDWKMAPVNQRLFQ